MTLKQYTTEMHREQLLALEDRIAGLSTLPTEEELVRARLQREDFKFIDKHLSYLEREAHRDFRVAIARLRYSGKWYKPWEYRRKMVNVIEPQLYNTLDVIVAWRTHYHWYQQAQRS